MQILQEANICAAAINCQKLKTGPQRYTEVTQRVTEDSVGADPHASIGAAELIQESRCFGGTAEEHGGGQGQRLALGYKAKAGS